MTPNLDAPSILSEATKDDGVGLRSGPNLASGTVREMIAMALVLPEERFRACFISILPDGPTLRPDAITEVASANDILPDTVAE